jgi:hypothetical protein
MDYDAGRSAGTPSDRVNPLPPIPTVVGMGPALSLRERVREKPSSEGGNDVTNFVKLSAAPYRTSHGLASPQRFQVT